jgi:hypothetical protein
MDFRMHGAKINIFNLVFYFVIGILLLLTETKWDPIECTLCYTFICSVLA